MANLLDNFNTVFVACYESGGAQIISSFIKNNRLMENTQYCLGGPARPIFENKLGKITNLSLHDITKLDPKTDLVMTGRSLVPEWERDAIRLAKDRGVKVVTFLDHWVNYEDSFIPVSRRASSETRKFLDLLPNEVIVGDKYAARLIKKTRIPAGIVRFIENEYFCDLKVFFKPRRPVSSSKKHILYISEPIYDDLKKIYGDGNKWGYNEFDVLKEIVNFVPEFKKMGFEGLIIRLHPNEKKEKYAGILNDPSRQKDFGVCLSEHMSLEEDILRAKLVLGMESMALVIAILAGVKTVSYLPKSAVKKCVLPYKELVKIKDLNLIKELKI